MNLSLCSECVHFDLNFLYPWSFCLKLQIFRWVLALSNTYLLWGRGTRTHRMFNSIIFSLCILTTIIRMTLPYLNLLSFCYLDKRNTHIHLCSIGVELEFLSSFSSNDHKIQHYSLFVKWKWMKFCWWESKYKIITRKCSQYFSCNLMYQIVV